MSVGSDKAGVGTLELLNTRINLDDGAVNRRQKYYEQIDAYVEENENELLRLLIHSLFSREKSDIVEQASKLYTEILKAKDKRQEAKLDWNKICQERTDRCAEFRKLLVSKNVDHFEVTKEPEQRARTQKFGELRNPYAVEELDQ